LSRIVLTVQSNAGYTGWSGEQFMSDSCISAEYSLRLSSRGAQISHVLPFAQFRQHPFLSQYILKIVQGRSTEGNLSIRN
jgi:hypothetical protein